MSSARNRLRVFTIREDVYKTEPLFVFNCDHAALARHLKHVYRQDVGLDIGQCGQMLTYDKAPHRVVWARRLDTGIVLHEIFHLVTRICYDKGIPIKAQIDEGNGDEAAAYLFEFFATRALKHLR